MRRIFLSGIGGGIASTFGYFLHKKGYKVFGCDNFSNGYKENLFINGEKYAGVFDMDIRDSSLSTILKNCKIDTIVHLAAISSLPECEQDPQKCFSVNTMGTLSVLEAARKANIKTLVFSSTSAIYENNTTFPFYEEFPVQPTLAYPLSKKLAEDICITYREKYGMRVPILRYFNVFGPRQDIYRPNPPLIQYIVKQILKNEAPIFHSNGEQKRDYVHVDDVCEATYQALIQDHTNSTYNVCSGKTLSVNQIYEIIQKTLDFYKPAQYNLANKLWSNYDISINSEIIAKETNKHSLGSNRRLKDDLGITINDNLEELIGNTAKEIYNSYKNKIK